MSINIILTILLWMNISLVLAQSHPYQVQFSYQIEQGIAEGTIRPSKAGLLYTLIGDYHNAISYSDIPISWGVDTLPTDQFLIEDALPIIVKEASNHQIVIISENHLKPQHRIFAKKIIQISF